MPDASTMARAAAPLADIIRDIKPDQLGAPTPCAEYDVRKLVNHLLFWGPSLEGAARKEAVLPPAATEAEVDLTEGGWADALEAHLDRTVSAWSHPMAWEGMTHLADPTTQLPAPIHFGPPARPHRPRSRLDPLTAKRQPSVRALVPRKSDTPAFGQCVRQRPVGRGGHGAPERAVLRPVHLHRWR